jgi:hypothetical protein
VVGDLSKPPDYKVDPKVFITPAEIEHARSLADAKFLEQEDSVKEFYDPAQPRAPKGSSAGGKWVGGKVSRALATYKPSTREMQRAADAQEAHVAQALGFNQHGDNDPVDVSGELNGKRPAVEVKTFISNKNDKVTVHPDSLRRKTRWARANKAQLHTVVVDLRSGRQELYYRRGVGSFRLGSLTPVTSAGHLKALVGGVGEFADIGESK